MTTSLSVRLISDVPINWSADWLTFGAKDANGLLQIQVAMGLWERLQAEAPIPCSADDRRDHALGMIEAEASSLLRARPDGAFRLIELG